MAMIKNLTSKYEKISKDILPAETINHAPFQIDVRIKKGERMEGLEVLNDGFIFRSSRPFESGEMVELMLCGGGVRIDAKVVGCARLGTQERGFAIRACYENSSPELDKVISSELERVRDLAMNE